MKITTVLIGLLLLTACGGGSQSGTGFNANLSGTWSGTIITANSSWPFTAVIIQPVTAAAAAVHFNGTWRERGFSSELIGARVDTEIAIVAPVGDTFAYANGFLNANDQAGGSYYDLTGITGTWSMKKQP